MKLNTISRRHNIKNVPNKIAEEIINVQYSNEQLEVKDNKDISNKFIKTIQNIIDEGHKQANPHTIRNTILGSIAGGLVGAGAGVGASSIFSQNCNNQIPTAEELLQQQNQPNISSNTKELLRYLEEHPQTEQEKILENMKTNITKCEAEQDKLEKKQQELIEQKKDLENELSNKTITQEEYGERIKKTEDKIENITQAINITGKIIDNLFEQYNETEANLKQTAQLEQELSQSLKDLQNCTTMDEKITALQNSINIIQENITQNNQTLETIKDDNRDVQKLLNKLEKLSENEDLRMCWLIQDVCVENYNFNVKICDTYTQPYYMMYIQFGEELYARNKTCLNETFNNMIENNNKKIKTWNDTINNDTLTIQSNQKEINQTQQAFDENNCVEKPFKNETLKNEINEKINETNNQIEEHNKTLANISKNLTDFQKTLKNLKEEDIDAIIANLKNLTQQQNITNNEIIENQYNINQTNAQIDNITNLIEEKNKTCEEQKQEYIDKSNYFASITTIPTSMMTYNTDNITGNNTNSIEDNQQCTDNRGVIMPIGSVIGLVAGAILGGTIANKCFNNDTCITKSIDHFYIPIDGKGKISPEILATQRAKNRDYVSIWFNNDGRIRMECFGESDTINYLSNALKRIDSFDKTTTPDIIKQAFKNLNKNNKTEALLLNKIDKYYKQFKNTTNDDIAKTNKNVLLNNAEIQKVKIPTKKEINNLDKTNKINTLQISNK